VNNNAQGTSQITFKGVEDLGGGLKASFLLENDFDAKNDATSNLGSKGGEQYTGLAGDFGSVKIGAPNTPTLGVQGARQPFGTKIGSGFGSSLGTKHVRNNNSVVYTSPAFSGFTVGFGSGFQTRADATASTEVAEVASIKDLALSYANGPFAAAVSNYTVKKLATEDQDNKQTNFVASYTIGAAKLIVGSVNETLQTGAKQSGSNVAGTYALSGGVTLMANAAKLNDKSDNDRNIKTNAVGVKKELSKRTSVYARYITEKTDNAADGKSAETKSTLVGIQHNF
jgi:predicted porin